MGLIACTQVHLGSLGFTWVHLSALGFTWVHMGALWFTWVYLGSLGFTWITLYSRVLMELVQNELLFVGVKEGDGSIPIVLTGTGILGKNTVTGIVGKNSLQELATLCTQVHSCSLGFTLGSLGFTHIHSGLLNFPCFHFSSRGSLLVTLVHSDSLGFISIDLSLLGFTRVSFRVALV